LSLLRTLAGLLILAAFGAGTVSARVADDQARLLRAAYAGRSVDLGAAERLAARNHDPALVPLAQWLLLMHGAGGFSEITQFLAAHPDWPGQVALRKRAEAETGGVSDATLLAWFQRYPPLSQDGKLKLAELMLDHGRSAEGINLVRDVWINGSFTRVEERLFLERYRSFLRPQDEWARLDRLLWDGSEDEARRMLFRVSPGEAALGEARLALADREDGAERLIARVPPELQRDPGLLYERMRWRRRKGHYDDAIELLEAAPKTMERPEAWAVEREILARYALADGKADVAYRIAAAHGLSEGPHFAELEFLAGWIALRYRHEPQQAYDHFVHLYETVKLPLSLSRGAYWSARAAEAMGYHQLADAWYGTAAEQITTYYGQLAAARIGAPGASRINEPQPSQAQIDAFEASPLVRATRALAEIGADEDVRLFIHHLADHATAPVTYALVARFAAVIGRPDLAIATAKRAGYAGVTLLAEGYPVEPVPPGGPVERPLVLAMTRQESAFDVGAVSSAGARGLMQLMPATARIVARSLGLPFSEKRLTGDRHYNLALGRQYLAGLINDFAGSYVLAVASYNAGPARVHEWMQDFGDPRAKTVDAIDWIESIPVSETRNYVQRVLENLQVYRLRLGDRRLAFSLASDLRR
jgi:soluble lytic murein transglycosylase